MSVFGARGYVMSRDSCSDTLRKRLAARSYKDVPPEEGMRLLALAQEGNASATCDFIALHSGLIEYLAKRYYWRLSATICQSIDLDDIRQVSRIAMLGVIYRFNPDLGYRFSTYAAKVICGAIGRFVRDNGTLVRVPEHVRFSYSNEKRKAGLKSRVRDAVRASFNYADIDDVHLPISCYEPDDRSSLVRKALVRLARERKIDDREIYIITERYLKQEDDCKTCRAVGNDLGVSMQRVQQIERRVIEKLKAAICKL